MRPDFDRQSVEQLLERLARLARRANEAPFFANDDSPVRLVEREFFANNWAECCDGLLRKTSRLSVTPENSPAPRVFRFEIDRPFKRKGPDDASAVLMPGPIRGTIHYRPDLYLAKPDDPYIAVQVDPDLAFLHPNCSRARASLVCLGALPVTLFPFPLDLLIETRLYPILTYQDRQPSHPFDLEAAAYFALDPHALDGLEPVEPLY